MKSKFTKALALLLAVLTLGYIVSVGAYAAGTNTAAKSTTHALVLTSEATAVAIGRTIQMTAKVSNVDKQPTITWSSSDASIASVDSNGAVKGKAVGKVIIKASAKVDGKTVTGEFAIDVIKNEKPIQNYLVNHQVLSYQYSYVDDYYYTNDKKAWQKHFGFGKIYDIASPYLLLEYDYIRIFFTYENKDWMIQFWKGQYGMIFYGGEVGVYNRAHSEEGVNDWTFYGCAKEEDWLAMDMTL